MKFQELPKFTKSGDYEVDIPLWFLEKNIQDYQESYGLDLNPDFQRGHVWTRKQQIAWMEYYFKGGISGRVIYFNCPYFTEKPSKKRDIDNMVIVDGLQRLTAFREFMRGNIPVFGYYLKDFENAKMALMKYTIRFNINCLQTRKEVLGWYLEMNSGGTPHSSIELERVQKMLEYEKSRNSE